MSKRRKTTITNQIRQYLRECRVSHYRIGQVTRISPSTLGKFAEGTRGLSEANLDILAEYLGLRVVQDEDE